MLLFCSYCHIVRPQLRRGKIFKENVSTILLTITSLIATILIENLILQVLISVNLKSSLLKSSFFHIFDHHWNPKVKTAYISNWDLQVLPITVISSHFRIQTMPSLDFDETSDYSHEDDSTSKIEDFAECLSFPWFLNNYVPVRVKRTSEAIMAAMQRQKFYSGFSIMIKRRMRK